MTLRRNIVPTFVIFVYKYNKALDVNVNVHHPFYLFNRQYSQQISNQDYKQYCSVLQVPENSGANDIRDAFIKLAKRFHPDSGHEEANAEKFKEIETAFRILKNHPHTTKVDEIEKSTEKQDIKHVAPQHRQYLSFDGVGSGSPYQRQQEYAKKRAMQAADNVLQHRLNKSSVQPEDKKLKTNDNKNYRHNHKIKTKYGIDRIVEDLIQESMSKGEFNNLPGSGKPLKLNQNFNPYVDFTTHKLNQVLIENGFTPEWITLQKGIREDITKLKSALAEDRKMFNAMPLTDEEERRWEKCLEKYHDTVDKINKKIQYYNLVVPILQKQMVNVNIKKLSKKILEKGVSRCKNTNSNATASTQTISSTKTTTKLSNSGFLRFIGSFINL
ncbi:dnaJ homolog subfamily C member 28 [Chrysoperla carnea]|uniref:dnaJ homolog subfamily C member 28 n=1 Tax=Chrysoperla carnea TaxID=189513 RepID=UPI001D066D93|nr:dnaJ homolog subfamily C member 28 [Chrysoperla carnea]